MPDVEIPAVWSDAERDREFARCLRTWFEIILDQMNEAALRYLLDECRRAAPSNANRAIEHAIVHRLQRASPRLSR